jgi:CHRD domain
LNWDQDRLASVAGLNVRTVRDFETERLPNRDVVEKIKHALERAGVEFTNGGAPGVRRQPEPKTLTVDELNASNDE